MNLGQGAGGGVLREAMYPLPPHPKANEWFNGWDTSCDPACTGRAGGTPPPFWCDSQPHQLLLSTPNCPPPALYPPDIASQLLFQPPVTAFATALKAPFGPGSPQSLQPMALCCRFFSQSATAPNPGATPSSQPQVTGLPAVSQTMSFLMSDTSIDPIYSGNQVQVCPGQRSSPALRACPLAWAMDQRRSVCRDRWPIPRGAVEAMQAGPQAHPRQNDRMTSRAWR